MNSIFTRLLASRANSKEDYLTECFAGLLEIWSKEDPSEFNRFLEWLTGKRIGSELKEISTQKTANEFGRPDLWVQFENHLILVENKWDAPAGDGQIERYFDYLKQAREIIGIETSLIFLSRWHNEYPWKQKKPDREVTWIEISREVKEKLEKSDRRDSPLSFYKKQFYAFLEDNNMVDKPVSWQYMEGVPALLRLIDMMKTALDELSDDGLISNPKVTVGQYHAGCYLYSPDGKNDFFFGQQYDGNYERLFFSANNLQTLKLPNCFETKDFYGNPSVSFSFSEHCFFSKDSDGQKNEIKEFIKRTLNLFFLVESQG